MNANRRGIPTFDKLPGDIYFRHQELEPTTWGVHAHPWGQLNFVSRGTMNIEIKGRRFVSPPHYAIWIPPDLPHDSANTVAATYRAVYVSREFSVRMPSEPCALSVTAILRALLDEFARLDVRSPNTPQEQRMAQVALDQIEAAAPLDNFLPYAASGALQAVLDEVSRKPRDKRSTQEMAKQFNMTSRTLERRCLKELGIGLGEWQHRFRFMKSLDALEAGITIQKIAYDLGYASTSAFITMFHRLSGQTPQQYRRSHRSQRPR
jgi:AraC-like DNA-binding protein